LEQVASGKLSAEAHLLQEKESLVKELEVLRSQLDHNPEITKFAI
jgi:kinesin family protein 15